jgi:hypothetical protein
MRLEAAVIDMLAAGALPTPRKKIALDAFVSNRFARICAVAQRRTQAGQRWRCAKDSLKSFMWSTWSTVPLAPHHA